MVEGYYGVGGDRYVVGDGDFLKLGHHNLRFYLSRWYTGLKQW